MPYVMQDGREFEWIDGKPVETERSIGKRLRRERAAINVRREKAKQVKTARLRGFAKQLPSVIKSQAKKRAAPWEGRGNRD